MMIERRRLLASMLATAATPFPLLGAARPAFKLYDTHAHLYSGDLDHYPFKADITAASRAKALSHPVTPEALFAMWDAAGVEMGCGVQYNTTYSVDNHYLLDSAHAFPKRIVPVVILDPTRPETPATLARMTREDRISGVRFSGLPDAAGNFSFLSDAAQGAWAAAEKLGLVVVLMPVRDNLPQAMKWIGEHAARYPGVTIVIDHVGFPGQGPDTKFGLSPHHLALAKHRNVNYKYTTLLIEELHKQKIAPADFLKFAVDTYGADHLVWGSDVGNTEGKYGDFVSAALDSARALAAAQRKAIFYDTAKRLFVPGGRRA